RRRTETLKMGSSARGAERGETVTLHNKTLSARLSPISQDGFPLRPLANARVSKCGGIEGVTTGPQGGQGTRQRREGALSQLVRGVGVRVSSGHVWGYAVGFGAFAVALLKRVMQRRACLPLAGAVFVVLLCAVGLEGEAQAQFGPPTVTNVNPNTGPTSGGTSVTIAGPNFSGATAVSFGSNAAGSFTVNSATQITATSPAGIGTVDVTVTTESGTSPITTADQFIYVPAPTVTNVNPNTGPTSGGTSVTITGTNFSGATAVRFGSNAAAPLTVDSATQITATSPAGIGTVDVTVTTAGGTSAISSGDRFTYRPVGTTTAGPVGTTTALSSSQNPSSFGQPVKFAVNVTGLSPTGSVSLFDGGTQIGTETLAAGIASFTISSLAVGSHSLTAQDSGDPNNAANTSAALIQTVNAPTDSIKLRAMQV